MITVIGSSLRKKKGREDNLYRIPVRNKKLRRLPLDKINFYVQQFLYYAKHHPDLVFEVRRINKKANYTEADIAPMFRYAPLNCKLTFKSGKLRMCPTCKRPL